MNGPESGQPSYVKPWRNHQGQVNPTKAAIAIELTVI